MEKAWQFANRQDNILSLMKRHNDIRVLEQKTGIRVNRRSQSQEDTFDRRRSLEYPKSISELSLDVSPIAPAFGFQKKAMGRQAKLVERLNRPKADYCPESHLLHNDYRGLICADHTQALEEMALHSSLIDQSRPTNMENTRNSFVDKGKLGSTMLSFPILSPVVSPHANSTMRIPWTKSLANTSISKIEKIEKIRSERREKEKKDREIEVKYILNIFIVL